MTCTSLEKPILNQQEMEIKHITVLYNKISTMIHEQNISFIIALI